MNDIVSLVEEVYSIKFTIKVPEYAGVTIIITNAFYLYNIHYLQIYI